MSYTENLVTVVIPVYNAEPALAETLDCLASQTYQDIEVLLVDDGSTDASADICRSFVERDSRFRYIYQDNAGAGAARNHGLDLACGEYVMFLDSDDLFEPTLLERLHEAIAASNADVAVCKADKFNTEYEVEKAQPIRAAVPTDEGCYRVEDIASYFFQRVSPCPWDKMFRTGHVVGRGIRFQTLRYSNDNYFVLLALVTASNIVLIDDVLVHYRYGQGGSLRDKMYLDPLCDLDMFDALRSSVAEITLPAKSDLMRSLDVFTLDGISHALFNLAAQSESACGEFLSRLRNASIPEWRRLSGFPTEFGTAKRKIQFKAITRTPMKGISWAFSPLGGGGWRSANKWTKLLVHLRFALAFTFMPRSKS